MAMSWIWGGMIVLSVIYGAVSGNMQELSTAALDGASGAVQLCLAISGATCFWCGLMEVMERSGLLSKLSHLMSPLLTRLFPSARKNPELLRAISANTAANLLGLGNAATPMGLKAVSLMENGGGAATDEMCRLIVINTASIQLIPATVAAVRAASGSDAPFDILPAVWLTSIVSVCTGIAAAYILKRLWKR
ncbi:MAG: nucleoside recognition domain-containing protein [Oscillospiraceae bacterium]